MTKHDTNSGCYQLYIEINQKFRLNIGARGFLNFRRGFYVYTGRAKRNLKARVERHKQHDKKIHWHIDYLLRRGRIIFIKYFPGRYDECIINEDVTRKYGEAEIVDGFGASDCKCSGHLTYLGSSLPDDETIIS